MFNSLNPRGVADFPQRPHEVQNGFENAERTRIRVRSHSVAADIGIGGPVANSCPKESPGKRKPVAIVAMFDTGGHRFMTGVRSQPP